jgi:hypothetical protein
LARIGGERVAEQFGCSAHAWYLVCLAKPRHG